MVSDSTLAKAPAWARTLLAEARHAHLGLVDGDGAPRVLPVTFAVVGPDLVTVVDDKPKRTPGAALARVRWLRRDPRAS